MKIQRFEDIIAWQKAQDLGVLVYKHFDETKDRSFRSQFHVPLFLYQTILLKDLTEAQIRNSSDF